MAKKKVTQFEKWFKAQFGRLPENFRPINDIRKLLQDAEFEVNQLRGELEWSKRISTEYRAASYTKNASVNKFKF